MPDPSGMAAVDVTIPQTWNRYAQVTNTPLCHLDPMGLNLKPPRECQGGMGIFPSEGECVQRLLRRPRTVREPYAIGYGLGLPLLICWTSASISSGASLPVYLGMRPLPLVMMLRRSSDDIAVALSEMSEGPP